MKFGQLTKYSMRNIFLHAENKLGRLVPSLFLFFKKQKENFLKNKKKKQNALYKKKASDQQLSFDRPRLGHKQ